MNYIFRQDLSFLIKDKLKLLLCFLSCLFSCLAVKIIVNVPIDSDLIKCIFGMSKDTISSGDILKIIVYILNLVFYSYLTMLVFMKDIEVGTDILFLRVKPIKWLITKILVICLYDHILLLVQYVLCYVVVNSINNVSFNFIDFISNYLIIVINILYTIFFFVACSSYKTMYVFGLIIFIILICQLLINYNLFYLVSIIILFLLIDIVIFKYNSVKVFENYRR